MVVILTGLYDVTRNVNLALRDFFVLMQLRFTKRRLTEKGISNLEDGCIHVDAGYFVYTFRYT